MLTGGEWSHGGVPVSVHPRGELLGHPRGTARQGANMPGGRAARPRCSLAQAALLAYPSATHPFSRARVLAWCEHLLSDDDGRPRGECLPAC